MNLAFNTELSMWPWYKQPENKKRWDRYGMAQRGGSQANHPEAILHGEWHITYMLGTTKNLLLGFDWNKLERGSIVVDVGGGIGTQSMVLAQNFEHLDFIVQDQPETMRDAYEVFISSAR
jgi:hypothetical protein